MITNKLASWEYKAVLLPHAAENIADTARLKELCEVLNKASLERWDPTDLSKYVPTGYVLLKRAVEAAQPAVKRSSFFSSAVTAKAKK